MYKCNICGNVVEILIAGVRRLVCCGQPIELLEEKSEGAGEEKHVPVIEEIERGFRVRVGSVPHPMEERHRIVWIEALVEGGVLRKFLEPVVEPVAELETEASLLRARGYCNLHGLWSAAKSEA